MLELTDEEYRDIIHRRNLQIADLKRKLTECQSLDRTKFTIRNRLMPGDLIAIRSALGQHVGVQFPDNYQIAMDHLNQMYPCNQSAEDAEVTHNSTDPRD